MRNEAIELANKCVQDRFPRVRRIRDEYKLQR
jgi:hypothetical protein